MTFLETFATAVKTLVDAVIDAEARVDISENVETSEENTEESENTVAPSDDDSVEETATETQVSIDYSTVSFVADYDTTSSSARSVTIVPSGFGYKRAGRYMLDSRVTIDVVCVKRTTDFATEAEFARAVALELADQNITIDGIVYLVEDIDAEPDPEQLESNVYSCVISVTYRATGTI